MFEDLQEMVEDEELLPGSILNLVEVLEDPEITDIQWDEEDVMQTICR